MGVVGIADVAAVRHDRFRATRERRQIRIGLRIVHVHILDAPDGEIAFDDHHVAAPARPMPAEGNWFAGAINLRFDLGERERRVRRYVRREAVFLILGPAPVVAAAGIIRTARREAEPVVRLRALGHVMPQEAHRHLPAGRPTPVGRLLRQGRDIDRRDERWITTGGQGSDCNESAKLV